MDFVETMYSSKSKITSHLLKFHFVEYYGIT